MAYDNNNNNLTQRNCTAAASLHSSSSSSSRSADMGMLGAVTAWMGGMGDGSVGRNGDRSVNSKNACVRRRKRWSVGREGRRGHRTPGRRRARDDVDRAPARRRIDSFRTGVKTPFFVAAANATRRLLPFLILVV